MDSSPFPGMLVGSNVRLKTVLGRGGMGSIWVAEHLSLQIDVAVKFLSPELTSLPEARARFEREAAAAALLKSSHVVQVYDCGVTDQGSPYIVMELLEGENLAQRLERHGPRPLMEVTTIFMHVARALAGAHARGVVHRDIKPDNIFITERDGECLVKLLDFGIAKRPQDHAMNVTQATAMMGTPHFMSPEQIMTPKEVDFRTDLWSLAVVMYAVLTGRLPFDGETIGALCVAVNAGAFEPVTRFRKDVPTSLDAWFERALQRDQWRRFSSIQEMATALERSVGLQLGPGLGGDFGRPSQYPTLRPPTPLPTDSGSEYQTFHGASVTNTERTSQSEWLKVLAAVITSVIVSATTTLLFLAAGDYGKQPTPVSAAAPAEGFVLPESDWTPLPISASKHGPEVIPADSSVPGDRLEPSVVPSQEARRIQANKPAPD